MIRRPPAEVIELRDNNLASDAVDIDPGIRRAAALLAEGGVLALRILPLEADKHAAIERGRQALTAITRELVREHALPPEAYVEVDEESYGTPVAPFQEARFLLPHHDGGHCSYLTPSRLDYPDLDESERTYSDSVYWKRPSHKLMQGFLITSTGEPPGITYYYNTLTLLWDAFLHRAGRIPASLSELGGFTVDNLRRSKQWQPIHQSRYFTLGAVLGAENPALHVMPSGPRAESELWPAQYINLPALCDLADHCPCGNCGASGERLFCHTCWSTLGRTWPQFRAEYETDVTGMQYDLILGNNLTQVHAAYSHMSRTIRPMCIVVDQPRGHAYERWMSIQWRTWRAGTGVTA